MIWCILVCDVNIELVPNFSDIFTKSWTDTLKHLPLYVMGMLKHPSLLENAGKGAANLLLRYSHSLEYKAYKVLDVTVMFLISAKISSTRRGKSIRIA